MGFNSGNGGISSATDVALDSPANSNTLAYNATTSKWTNRTTSLLKADLSINNIDNTSDANKPVSAAVADALATKADVDTVVANELVTTKGDLLVASANATITRLAVGANSQVLTADSTTATGLKWAAAGSATGNDGPQGPPGLVWRSAWNTNVSYAADDAVQFNGRGFIALQASIGITPPSTATSTVYWDLLVDSGATGSSGSGSAFVGEIVIPIQKAIDITSTTFANRYDPTVFDLSQYPAGATVHFRTDISQANSGTGLVEVRLACMTDNNTTVVGSTLSASVNQYDHSIQTSANIRTNLQPGVALYSLEVRADAGFSGQVLSPALVVRYS